MKKKKHSPRKGGGIGESPSSDGGKNSPKPFYKGNLRISAKNLNVSELNKINQGINKNRHGKKKK